MIEELTKKVNEGKYKAGDKLPTIKQLSLDYGVSITVVREAVKSMEIAGILTLKHGSGIYIAESSLFPALLPNYGEIIRTKLKALYEMRMILEVGCASLVIERITNKDIDALKKTIRLARKTGEGEWADHDIEFHYTIAKCTGNKIIANTVKTLLEALRHDISFTASFTDMLKKEDIWEEGENVLVAGHKKILNVIENRNVAELSNAIKLHIMTGLRMHEVALKLKT